MMGGKRSGAGRPPGSTSRKPTREIIKQIRWTQKEWREVERAARDAGKTPSKYIREKVIS